MCAEGCLCIYRHIVFNHVFLKNVHKLTYLSVIVKCLHVFNGCIGLMELQWHSPLERWCKGLMPWVEQRNYASENSNSCLGSILSSQDMQLTPFLGCWKSPHMLSHEARLDEGQHHASSPPFPEPLLLSWLCSSTSQCHSKEFCKVPWMA